MPSPRPSTHAVAPFGIRLAKGCISCMPPIWSMISSDGSSPPQVQGDQAAGQLGNPVLEGAPLAQPAEDLEGERRPRRWRR